MYSANGIWLPNGQEPQTLADHAAADGQTGQTLRVVTYTIHKGVQGIWPNHRLEIHNLQQAIAHLQADVVCLQETKLTDDAFAELFAGPLAERGYEFASNGQGQWNGVALLSRVGLDDVERGFPQMPGFPGPEARAISASCDGLRVHSLYVPNGRELGHPHLRYTGEQA